MQQIRLKHLTLDNFKMRRKKIQILDGSYYSIIIIIITYWAMASDGMHDSDHQYSQHGSYKLDYDYEPCNQLVPHNMLRCRDSCIHCPCTFYLRRNHHSLCIRTQCWVWVAQAFSCANIQQMDHRYNFLGIHILAYAF